MSRRILALVLAVLMTLCLAGCGDKEEQEPEEKEQAAEATEKPEEKTTDWKPESEITLLVPYAAGSLNDITARVLAQYLERFVGQLINVENIPGAYTEKNEAGETTLTACEGTVGWAELVRRPNDGLTLGYVKLPDFTNAIVQWPQVCSEANYTPICTHTVQTAIVVIRKGDERFSSLQDLVDYGKKNPGALIAATDTEHGTIHSWTQAFAKDAGIGYTPNHQSSANGAIQCVRNGSADFCIVSVDDILEWEEGLLLLGVCAPERLSQYPDVPTLEELGFYSKWLGCAYCVMAPAGISEDAVTFYEQAFRAAMEEPRYLSASSGVTTQFMDARDTAALIDSQRGFALRVAGSLW